MILGWAATLAWLIFIYRQIGKSAQVETLNEFGDFIAGAFAPLAFLWLVLGYYQQGKELQQNTEALRLQADELKATNDTLKVQTEELQKNVEHQGQLVLINQQEVDAKHFSAKPFLLFRRTSFSALYEPYTIEDEEGVPIQEVDIPRAQFLLEIENKGEVAKQISMRNKDEHLKWQEHEINKNEKKSKFIDFDEETAEKMLSNAEVSGSFSFQFFDTYGREYNNIITYNGYYHEHYQKYDLTLKVITS